MRISGLKIPTRCEGARPFLSSSCFSIVRIFRFFLNKIVDKVFMSKLWIICWSLKLRRNCTDWENIIYHLSSAFIACKSVCYHFIKALCVSLLSLAFMLRPRARRSLKEGRKKPLFVSVFDIFLENTGVRARSTLWTWLWRTRDWFTLQ